MGLRISSTAVMAMAPLWVALTVISAVAQTISPAPPSATVIETVPLSAPAPATAPQPVSGVDVPKVESPPAAAPSPVPQVTTVVPTIAPTLPTPTPTLTSLAPPVSEATLPDPLELQPKPAVIVHGKAQWESAYNEIRDAFARGRASAEKAGLVITGYPVTVFVDTNDTSFTYDAILPVASVPELTPVDFPTDTRLGTTPAGKAIRFAHLASYDEIDGAYEQITAYLDAKDIVVKDAFIEEYLVFGDTSASPATTINIFVQPKK